MYLTPIWTVFDLWLSSLCKYPHIAWTSISVDLVGYYSIFVAEIVYSSSSCWWESSTCWGFFLIIFVWVSGINGSIRDCNTSPSVQEESGLQLLLYCLVPLLSWRKKISYARPWKPSTSIGTFQLLVLSSTGRDTALVGW